jgi:hypothetical protein
MDDLFWNHRLIRVDGMLVLAQVYYRGEDTDEPFAKAYLFPGGETIEEIRRALEMAQGALDLPVLDVSIFEQDEHPAE